MGALKNKNIVTKKLIEIFEISNDHINEQISDPNNEYAKLLAGEDATIDENVLVSSTYIFGDCIKNYKSVTINVFSGDDKEVANNFVRVIVVYGGFYEAYFRNEEWDMVLKNLNSIISKNWY